MALDTQVGLNCDSVLRNQLIFQRGASTADRMQVVISQIQAQQQECAKDVWKPVAIDMGTVSAGKIEKGPDGELGQCYQTDGGFTTPVADLESIKVGDQALPEGLARTTGTGAEKKYYPRSTSGRDSENDIIVYWADDVADRPSDAASCWLYFSRLRSWDENFVQ